MQRSRTGAVAPISLILALVFPAMIAAALALAYYGFRYADSMSRPIEALFREYSRKEAETFVTALESRVDEPVLSLFRRIAAERREPSLPSPCDVDAGAFVESYVILDAAKVPECFGPAGGGRAARALRAGWDAHLKSLNWDAVKLDSHHHYHETGDRGSTLVVFTARKDEAQNRYYVAARLALDIIRQRWIEQVIAAASKNLQVTVVDDAGGFIAGVRPRPSAASDDRFLNDYDFGKVLYRWRLRMAPRNAEVFRAEAERLKLLGPLLIILSTVIIAVGLGIIWLAVLAERRASRLKSDFIANVSHELKTPLSLIRMFGEMVASGRHKGEGAAREYGAIITRESERLSHLIDNVLDFARLERGKASYDFAEGDLAEVLERALDVCRYRLDKERLKLRVEIEPDLPRLRMDDNAVTLVILNLVDNAIKYAADGGEVAVQLGRSPGGVALEVRDHGPGIAPEEQQRVFDRFYRARSARDRNVRGSGIGLALVKHIAEAHGGRVEIESPVSGAGPRPEPGTRFRVTLPAPMPEAVSSDARHELVAAAKPS